MKCGNCKGSHELAAEVRECYDQDTQASFQEANLQQDPFADMTPAQRDGRHSASAMVANMNASTSAAAATERLYGPRPAPEGIHVLPRYDEAGKRIVGHQYYKVQKAIHGSGRNYAKLWNPDTGKWVFVAGAVRLLSPDTKVSAEEAARFGKLYGQCCFCSRGLTDERSIDVGYGPVCADKNGLPWG